MDFFFLDNLLIYYLIIYTLHVIKCLKNIMKRYIELSAVFCKINKNIIENTHINL